MPDTVLSIVIKSIDQGATQGLRDLQAETGALNATIGQTGEAMAAGAAAGLGLVAAYAAVKTAIQDTVGAAANFEQALVTVQNNTTMTDQDVATMRDTVLSLSASTGAPLDQLTAGFQRVFNITGNTADAMAILDEATKSAVSTGGDAAVVANVLANAMHEYGVDTLAGARATGEFNSVADAAAAYLGTLHNAAALGNTTLEQFAESSGRAVGIAANLGVSLDDVSAAMVALTKHGLDSAQAQTQVTDMMQHIIAPSASAKAALEDVGKAAGVDLIDDFTPAGLAAKGLNGVITDLHDALIAAGYSADQATGMMMQFIPALRGGQGAAILAGTGLGDYNTILQSNQDHVKNAQVAQDALNRTLDTTIGQWDQLKASAGAAGQAIGGPVNEALKNMLEVGNRTIAMFRVGADLAGTLASAWVTDADLGKALGDEMDHLTASLHGVADAQDRILAENAAAHESLTGGTQTGVQAAYDYVNQLQGQSAKALQDTYTAAIATVTDEQKGIASNIRDEQTAIRQTTADYQAQLDPLQRKLDLENQSYQKNSGDLKSAIAGITAEYQKQLQPLQDQQAQLKLNLETQQGPLNAAADQIKLQYDGQIAPLQQQLDTMKAQYEQQTGPLNQAVAQITADYDKQIEPLQTQLDHLKTQYDLQSGPIKDAVEQVTAQYNAQIQPLQDQADRLKLNYDLQSGPLQEAVDQITASYEQQIAPLQQQLDLLNQQYAVASGALKLAIEQITDSFAAQIDPQQHALDLLNQQFTIRSDDLNRAIQQTTDQYTAQLQPLQDQLAAMQQQNQYASQQLSLQEQLAGDKIQQALLDAEGDPAIRAKIAGQLAVNKAQEDALKLQEQEASLQQQLNAPNLTDAKRQDLQLQLQDTQLQLQLAGMVNQPATNQLLAQQQQLAVQKQSADLTRQMADDQQKLAEIPLQQQIQQLTQAEKDALQPLQDQLATLKAQHDLEAEGMQQAIDSLKNQEYDRLTPLQQQLTNLTLQHDTAIGPLTTAITGLKSEEEKRLAPMQEQLKMLQLQYNTAVGPVNLSIEQLKAQEHARLEPMQNQLTQLQLQYNLANGPLTLAVEALKGKENDRLAPIKDQLATLKLQYDEASGPLTTALTNLQNAEKARLTPIQQQLATLQLQYDLANTKLQPEIDALTLAEKNRLQPIQDQLQALNDQHTTMTTQLQGDIETVKLKEQDALKPLQDQLQTYQDMNTQLGDLIQGWKDLAGAQGEAAAAIPSGGFHAPGKGPQGGSVPLYGNDPNVKATFEGYAAQHGLNPEQLWMQQSGNLNATPYTGGGGGNEDVVALAEDFTDRYAYGSGSHTYCERFVANIEGRPVQDTAYTAAQRRIAAHQMQFTLPPPPGAEVYFGPTADNENMGHVGIAVGGDTFRSVTSSGIRDADIVSWSATSAPFIGWVPAHTPMLEFGGVVPGPIGAPQLVIAHGGEEYLGLRGERGTLASRAGDMLDYDRIELAMERAISRLAFVADGRALGAVTRTDQRRFNASSPTNGVGGRL